MKTQLKPDELSALLRQRMEGVDKRIDTTEFGTVLTVGDGIARVDGLEGVMYNELVETENGVAGLALNLEEDVVGIAVLDSDINVREGDRFHRTGRVVSVPAGPALTGRSSAFSLSTGRAPGRPAHTGQQWVLGAPPNWVVQAQKILLRVASSTWVSRPMTVSQVMSVSPLPVRAGASRYPAGRRGRRSAAAPPRSGGP